jgi:ATP-dependent Clp protease adaptor protein ClpS
MSTTDTIIEKKQTTRRSLKEPSKYKVICCNDDVTPVDFVIAMLMHIFKYSQQDAVNLTLDVHNKGSAIIGVYVHEIAEQKALEATDMARSNGFPLIIKVEAE